MAQLPFNKRVEAATTFTAPSSLIFRSVAVNFITSRSPNARIVLLRGRPKSDSMPGNWPLSAVTTCVLPSTVVSSFPSLGCRSRSLRHSRDRRVCPLDGPSLTCKHKQKRVWRSGEVMVR